MFCPKCGKENGDNDEFCKHCGASLTQNNTISFEQLNGGNGNSFNSLARLEAEAKSARLFSILAIVFCALNSFWGLIFAIITTNKVNMLNATNFMPKDIKDIDEYEALREKVKKAGKLAKISYIVFIISTVVLLAVYAILYMNGIDIYSYMGF